MKSVLVTGGAGFVGSHLVRKLLSREVKVVVLDDLSTGSFANIPDGVPLVRHDVSEPIDPYFWRKYELDTVFHLAAVPRISMAWENPDRCELVNVTGTKNVLCDIALAWDTKVVFASTSCCQGDAELNPYALSKRGAERECLRYQEAHGLKVTVARLFNVYGPGEHETGPAATLVGKFARAVRDGEPLAINGDGSQRRDFVHVEDVADAMILLAEKDEGREGVPYDVGTGHTHSVNDVASLFDGLDNERRDPTSNRGVRPQGELQSTRANPERLFALGWEPKHNLKDYVRSVL